MAKKQKRDNAYYEDQLKKRAPAIHSDFMAGKYPSLAQALIAAGIKKGRTRISELKNAWEKASDSEQKAFLELLDAQGVKSTVTPRSIPASAPIAVERRLGSWAASRIEELMDKLNLQVSDVMHHIGYKKSDTSLSRTLVRKTRLQPALIAALEKWLKANEAV